jgi:N-acetylglucosaminyldiphosphoundecaprenol N-acetyl-beta-D-mannosaminyltransferase
MQTTSVARGGERVRILGVGVDRVDMDVAVRRMEKWAKEDVSRVVATADSSGLYLALTDQELRSIYDRADLVTPDSAGVLWAAKRKGVRLKERVSGVDLLDRVCALSARDGHRIFLLGAAPGVADEAAERLRLRHPGCNIVGTRNGYFPAESDDVVADEIGELRPDFLFVAMGIPRQERFILSTLDRHRAKVSMGVGGSLDVFSGRVRRAPVLFQRLRLEWLWRLASNPKKIGKVALLPKFVLAVLRDRG